ncbi:MAG: serine dehydrogenasease [Planctomycetes bacterium]|nr:serine dehydrogenasease [Planctomycetota bacterium]
MKLPVDQTIHDLLTNKLKSLEKYFKSDVISYFGPIIDGNEILFMQIIEQLNKPKKKNNSLYIILTTQGGSAIAVERYVNIVRNHYQEVNFIIPDYAYSAGTIFCLSGDNIHMDYFSVLGPIDPQVQNKEGKWVPALGYLDKVNEMLEKAKNKNLTQAEFLILKDIDLAELRAYEQAKELTITLLKKWLVKYKFKNWIKHGTAPELLGKEVTDKEKERRAEEIADELGNNKTWKSHGRPINIETLVNEPKLRLKIEDFGKHPERRKMIREYYNLLSDYIKKSGLEIFIHSREFI